MADRTVPPRCSLCDQSGELFSAGFRQIYRQMGRASEYLTWWECRLCQGWFVHPVPTKEVILLNCAKAPYNDPARAIEMARAKESVQRRILFRCSAWTRPGALLDYGCSFGEFLVLARAQGWNPSGFDPNDEAVRQGRLKGFDVRPGWELQAAAFPEKNFAAITANDSFCFSWHPHDTLQLFYRLLEPGGVLAMRLSNKRTVAGVVRALSLPGPTRDRRVSRVLQGQFHSIAVKSLAGILHRVGFERVEIDPWAPSISWRGMSASARLAYLPPQVLNAMTFGKVNLSPGVLLFAQKPR